MKTIISIKVIMITILLLMTPLSAKELKPLPIEPQTLTSFEKRVLKDKATERPFTGIYNKFDKKGTYFCKQCGEPLFTSNDKFKSHCGWPSFDDSIEGQVKKIPDADGHRVEIVCAKCDGHLGHIFKGEGYTAKNQRFCVNSASLQHKALPELPNFQTAYFAGGCFWGVEYYLEAIKGVQSVVSGYMGGFTKNPSYQEVSYKNTGHIESVKVVYDANVVSYETVARTFFEIHDPTQVNRQGPDRGLQYRSAIFYNNAAEKLIINNLIKELKENGYKVATELHKAVTFYDAEEYHQDYYKRHKKQPYCHGYVKRF
jgi:peptide methionine sulfoxide reductase msrA/msrB